MGLNPQQQAAAQAAGTAALGIGTGTVGGLIGAGIQTWQQGNLNDQQYDLQAKLMRLQQKHQMDMWKATGPVGQMEQYKAAGLNPALMYGMSGGGGQTAQSQTGEIHAPQAENASSNIIAAMGIANQSQQVQAEIELAKSQANLNNTQAKKLAGVDTTKVEAETQLLAQGLSNMQEDWNIKRLQQTMMNIQNFEQQATQADRIEYITYQAEQAYQQLQQAKNTTFISTTTIQDQVKIIQQNAIAAGLQNELTKVGIKLNQAQITEIKQAIDKMQTDMIQQGTRVSTEQYKAQLEKQMTDYITSHPTWQQVGGNILDEMKQMIQKVLTSKNLPFAQ